MAKPTLIEQWTRSQVALLGCVCLAAGLLGGWSIRAWGGGAGAAETAEGSAQAGVGGMKAMADAQAKPLLLKLKSDPDNPDLLISVGNSYYDAQQYPTAIEYYRRALNSRPSDASVRTDLGTAYWYTGDADTAITEFNQALNDAPNNPNTLFNRGLVKWKGKQDGAGALADWQKLLAVNPTYEARDKVEQMMTEVKQRQGAVAGSADK